MNPVKSMFYKSFPFDSVPIYKQMIYNNPEKFQNLTLSAYEIYDMSITYAEDIGYNFEGIIYTKTSCSFELPSIFPEVRKFSD